MKTILTLAAGYFLPSILHSIALHPGALDMLIGVLFGVLAGLLVALVMATPAQRQPVAIARPVRRQVKQATKPTPAFTFTPVNYEWSAA